MITDSHICLRNPSWQRLAVSEDKARRIEEAVERHFIDPNGVVYSFPNKKLAGKIM